MKNQHVRGRRFVRFCVASALVCTAGSAWGQDALRSSIAGMQASDARKKAVAQDAYNLSLGPLKVQASGSMGAEYNDNVTLVEANRVDDYILTPRLDLRATMPVTELNRLSFTLGLGYAFYANQSDLDYLLVTPGSEMSFDIFVGDWVINLHDRISHTQDPITEATLSGVGQFGHVDNTAGVQITANLNQLQLGVGYDHYNWWSTRSMFKGLDRTSDLLNANVGLRINPTTVLGVEAGGGFTDYSENVQNDYTHYSVGPYLEAALTEYITVRADAGFTRYNYDTTGRIGDPEGNLNGIYGMLSLRHRVNENFSHTFSAIRQVQPGTSSNFLELYTLREDIAWKLGYGITLSVPLFYDHGGESGLTAERLDRYGAGVMVGYQLMEKLQVNAGYQFVKKDSDRVLRGYDQNRVTVDLTYRF